MFTKSRKLQTGDEGADDTDNNIANQTKACPTHDLACGPAGTARLIAVQARPMALQKALEGIVHKRLDALYTVSNGLILIARKSIISFAAANGLPAIYTFAEPVADGGLMSYGANRRDLYERAGLYAARILHGAKPTELPIEQPTKFELLINLKTAKALGITIPPTVLALADEVIE
jgi:putative ABC transport system substrate-binding protein